MYKIAVFCFTVSDTTGEQPTQLGLIVLSDFSLKKQPFFFFYMALVGVRLFFLSCCKIYSLPPTLELLCVSLHHICLFVAHRNLQKLSARSTVLALVKTCNMGNCVGQLHACLAFGLCFLIVQSLQTLFWTRCQLCSDISN